MFLLDQISGSYYDYKMPFSNNEQETLFKKKKKECERKKKEKQGGSLLLTGSGNYRTYLRSPQWVQGKGDEEGERGSEREKT